MLTATLALKSLRNRRLTSALTVVAIALSVALLVGVENVRTSIRDSFAETISQTDLIVGSRGSSTQLVLSSVFGLGSPSAGVSWRVYQEFDRHPAVAWTIPLSLGDSHRGYRVIGTTNAFFEHYRYRSDQALAFGAGGPLDSESGAVLGAEVARSLGYSIGDAIELSHGMGPMSFTEHEDHPFRVVGILNQTLTPVDRAVYVTLGGIDAMHEGFDQGGPPSFAPAMPGASPPPSFAPAAPTGQNAAPPAASGDGEEPISSFLVGTRSRLDALQLQQEINTFRGEPLTAVLPGIALAEMWRTVGYAEDALKIVSAFVVLVGLLGMIVALYTSLNERRREMAVLRAIGARKGRVITLLVLESGVLALLGSILGIALVYGLLLVGRGVVEREFGLFVPIRPLGRPEMTYVAVVIGAGFLLGLVPALKAYRNALIDGLSIRL